MPKYLFADGGEAIDFNNMIDAKDIDDPDIDPSANEINRCLISYEPLTSNHVVLDCHHTFNYIPLYKEVIHQKKTLNSLDIDILGYDEIKCPYCRKKQQKLLPFYNIPGVIQIHEVNWVDDTKLYKWGIGTCAYCPVNKEEYGAAGYACKNKIVYKLSDGKKYCSPHVNCMKKIIKKQDKETFKLIKKSAKMAAKVAHTFLAKKAKQSIKSNLNCHSITNENVIVSVVDPLLPVNTNPSVCGQILKTGSRKGEKCGHKTSTHSMCLRHYNLQLSNSCEGPKNKE